MRFIARRWDDGTSVRVTVDEGRFQHFEPCDADENGLPWVAPGLVDLQVNGIGGIELTDPELTVDRVMEVATRLDAHGVTRFCPTVTTQSHDVLSHSLSTIAAAAEHCTDVHDRFAGIHLEGPFISPEDGPRGAHPLACVRPPNWDEFLRLQEAAKGQIRIVTLSPEYEEATQFIAKAVASGVVVAIGHTAADRDAIRAAVDAGATMSTHLGNGAHGVLRRHPNYIWSQLAEDRLVASIIADGHHLPPEVVQTFVRAKTEARIILVSDLVGTAGRPPGRYDDSPLGSVEVLPDGRIVIAGQRQLLAGAFQTLEQGVANAVRFAGVSLATAIEMASSRPAAIVGESDFGFRFGAPADCFLFQWDSFQQLKVTATFNRGNLVFGACPTAE